MWTAALVAVSALAHVVFGAPNAAYLLFEAVSRWLPGSVISFGINTMVRITRLVGAGSTASAAKSGEKILAVVLALVAGAIVGAFIAFATRGARRASVAIGLTVGVMAVAISWWLPGTTTRASAGGLVVLAAELLAWGMLIGGSIAAGAIRADEEPELIARRHATRVLAASALAIVVVAWTAARWLGNRPPPRRHAAAGGDGTAPPPEQAGTLEPVPGTRPIVTPTGSFYRIDIDLDPPSIDADSWRLEVGGLVGRPLSLDLDQLRAMPAVTIPITLECISNPVGGDLISTALWTGVRLADVLRDAGVEPPAVAVSIHSADGFHESASLEDANGPDALLVYAMNGEPLSREHGFPLRLYLPDRHGMKLPKWIERIELVDSPATGYWVERGWSRRAIVHTTSVIDVIHTRPGATGQSEISAGGIAYAGSRGISKVEVQVDEEAWRDAQLLPSLGKLTWVQWRYDGAVADGSHRLRVRAYDGTGALQTSDVEPPDPDGATGLDSKRFTTAVSRS